MKAPASDFFRLAPGQRREAHLFLCRHALRAWQSFIHSNTAIEYRDSVVGLAHVVDVSLPSDALDAVVHMTSQPAISARYTEPIVALQDGDLEFPQHIEYAYYAIYNLFRHYVEGADIEDWLIVNQALSSESDESLWSSLLQRAIVHATTKEPQRSDQGAA